MHDDEAMVRILLAAGADVRVKTRLGAITPLLAAAKGGSASVLPLLLKAGADANSVNASGATPLMLAAASGHVGAVEVLLQHGAQVNAKDATYGQTALMFAAAMDRAAAIRVLMKHRADAAIAPKTMEPACGSLFAIPMCGGGCGGGGDSGAKSDSNPPLRRRNRGPSIIGGLTALQFDARDGRVEAVKALIESGANINEVGAGEKMSPLVMAISSGHHDLAKVLLDRGGDPNLASGVGLSATRRARYGVGALCVSAATDGRPRRSNVP